ncbi:MAG: RpiB/LacA/LacB family sugar-phosphate isomerase [Candidatus Magasanikbacteria bacterium]|nr:RpiB/LacA/LacB family sugar-phosphate isomerase [Candidatus Magasanikbacteria bacterium]
MEKTNQQIFIGTDHAGFKLKEEIKLKLTELGYTLVDLSPNTPDPGDDYPSVAKKVTGEVLKNNARGILLCGSGNGICMAANKIKGIRAAVGYNTQSAKSARNDENTNILCLAGAILSPEYAVAIAKNFLDTPFSNEERHQKRIEELSQLEK